MTDPRYGDPVGPNEMAGMAAVLKAAVARNGGKLEFTNAELEHAATLSAHVDANPDRMVVELVEGLPPDVPRFDISAQHHPRDRRDDKPTARALRAIQVYDELVSGVRLRELLIEAETALGEHLGLACEGEPSGWDAETNRVVSFDHNGDTCPVHEWLVPSDCPAEDDPRRTPPPRPTAETIVTVTLTDANDESLLEYSATSYVLHGDDLDVRIPVQVVPGGYIVRPKLAR